VAFFGTPVSSNNKTDCHDIAEILLKVLKVALNIISQIKKIKDIKEEFSLKSHSKCNFNL
jgi:hypothetical protein